MASALVTSEMNEEKKEHLVQMVTNAVRKGIKVIGLNDDSGQRVVNRGTELVDAIFDKIRELSLELPEMPCFGVADWQTFYNITLTPKQIEAVSTFPWSEKTLNAPCPFNSGKMVRETHFAFVGLDSITMMELQRLNPKATEPRLASYASESWYAKEKFATKIKLGLRWYLLLKDVVPGSENQPFDEQVKMLPKEYEVPTAVAETAKDLLYYKKTGIYVNGNRYARTSDLGSDGIRVGVGLCLAGGVVVSNWNDDDRDGHVGVGACRKFEKNLAA